MLGKRLDMRIDWTRSQVSNCRLISDDVAPNVCPLSG
jgi:hypothetical protein